MGLGDDDLLIFVRRNPTFCLGTLKPSPGVVVIHIRDQKHLIEIVRFPNACDRHPYIVRLRDAQRRGNISGLDQSI
jgi:hypothetical protein